jgi:hypothetical protein
MKYEAINAWGRMEGFGEQYGCHRFFCGWCFEKFEDTSNYHRHVKICPMSYFPRKGDWGHVALRMKKGKIEAYLDQLASEGVSQLVVDDIMRNMM